MEQRPLLKLRQTSSRSRRLSLFAAFFVALEASLIPSLRAGEPAEKLIPQGSYVPFFKGRRSSKDSSPEARKAVPVAAFWLDVNPVTNGDFLKFVKTHPRWRRSQVGRVFADESYLKYWKSDLNPGGRKVLGEAVTRVSWFAATAYCEAQGKELPSTDQWEYAAYDNGRDAEKINKAILSWYSTPNSVSATLSERLPPNGYGIHDLFGVVWEWTSDFNGTMISNEMRNSGTKDEDLFCGAGSLGALDTSDFAKFMRYSLRSSLKANYTTKNLGFRCARNIPGENPQKGEKK